MAPEMSLRLYGRPLVVTDSGGKDSAVCREIVRRAGIPFEIHYNPIVDWRDADVWEYIRSERLEINPLYDMGFYRVVCLGCPMAGKNRWTEFRLFPTYQQNGIRKASKITCKMAGE